MVAVAHLIDAVIVEIEIKSEPLIFMAATFSILFSYFLALLKM
jgi:hypothetical protein